MQVTAALEKEKFYPDLYQISLIIDDLNFHIKYEFKYFIHSPDIILRAINEASSCMVSM